MSDAELASLSDVGQSSTASAAGREPVTKDGIYNILLIKILLSEQKDN